MSHFPGRNLIPLKSPADAATDRAKGEINAALEKLNKIYPEGFTGTLTLTINCAGPRERDRFEISDKPTSPDEQFDPDPATANYAMSLALGDLRTRLAYDLGASTFWGNVTLQMTVQRGMVTMSHVEGRRLSPN